LNRASRFPIGDLRRDHLTMIQGSDIQRP